MLAPLLHPAHALVEAAFHLADVGHRMDRPGVARLHVERLAAGRLGTGVLVAFLQPEGVHAQQVAVARVGLRPVGQHTRDAVAQPLRLAEVEVGEVRELHRQQVPGVVHQMAAQQAVRGVELPLLEGAERLGERAFPFIGNARVALGRFDALAGHGHQRALHRGDQQACLQELTGDEIGLLRQGGVDGRKRVQGIGVEQGQRLVVGGGRGSAGVRELQAASVA